MSGVKLKENIKKRERLFGSLKLFIKFLESYDPVKHSGQIQTRLDKLELKWAAFDELQEEIAVLDEKDELEMFNFEAAAKFESQYYEIRASLLAKLPMAPPVMNMDNTIGRNTTLGLHTGVRLPQISIPDFDGDYRQWLSFKATFVSLIHDSMELSEVQKFHYLKSALKGEAAKLVESLTLTNENYIIAWETITKRYSNEKLLKKRHLQALMEYPRINKESAMAIHGLVDEFEQRLKILKQLGEKVEHWGAMIVFWMCSKLDMNTLQLWEDYAASLEDPSFTVLVDFLERRTRVLEAVGSNSADVGSVQIRSSLKRQQVGIHVGTDGGNHNWTCVCCGESHYMSQCGKFLQMDLKERLNFINTKRLCSSCLKTGHWARNCNSKYRCRTCYQKHHSLIHPGFSKVDSEPASVNNVSTDCQQDSRDQLDENGENDSLNEQAVGSYSVGLKGGLSSVFLSTVVLVIRDSNGSKQLARALLDNGSQANIISERLCQMLKLKRKPVNIPVCGVGQAQSHARHAVHATVGSRISDFSIGMEFLVLQRVTTDLPAVSVPVDHWKIPQEYRLADPEFNSSSRIDLLIGAEHFFQFFYQKEMQSISLGPGVPYLVDTVFGWVVSGKADITNPASVICNVATDSTNLVRQLERFWTVETNENQLVWTAEERDCEEHYKRTYKRDDIGRYLVELPKKVGFDRMLGSSKTVALNRFWKMEQRLETNSEMRQQYHDFMKEYLELGHMRKLTEGEMMAELGGDNTRKVYYLPHHAVVKDSSTTTKVRVVFDGSARTDTGFSLNDCLLKGPTIQDSLLTLLLRFRKHEVALVGDVEKMYRQVRLHSDDTLLQRIFWRFSKHDPLDIYELLTVTYGLTPSSFLATRCLQQLAQDEGINFPRAKQVIENDFYVDDCITGAASIEDAILLRNELIAAMKKGGFPLRKLCSNRPEVLNGLPENLLGTHLTITFDFDPGEEVKTLGITWDPKADELHFVHIPEPEHFMWTRRKVLSTIAKLFDPLGLISPVVVTAKILMQELALLQTKWDDPVPNSIEQKWLKFYGELPSLCKLKISRFAFASNYVQSQIHCFADASELAYGACVYLRSTDPSGGVRVELLAAKSRVAPLKRLTLPRLELCAAKEAAELHSNIIKALSLNSVKSVFWSDSTIVLHWLKAQPNTWNTFVANRVSSIQTCTFGHQWNHIAGKENPADLVSRGLNVEAFLENQLWKNGPKWLREPEKDWPAQNLLDTLDEGQLEIRKIVNAVSAPKAPESLEFFKTQHTLNTLLRIVAFCLRFSINCRTPDRKICASTVTADELHSAKMALVKLIQSEHYFNEIKHLKIHHIVPSKSSLKLLNPFLDKNGIIRVGGRLNNSSEKYCVQHPAVLPPTHPFTHQLINYTHIRTMHGSHRLTLSVLRQEFWPIHGKRAVKSVIRRCYECFRSNPISLQQPTGQLPSTRVHASKPFHITGVDYCGPFFLKPPHRRAASPKCYIAVFVCFSTKAIHLELVGDLSTASFISAFRRFIGHHGIPAEMHSDNAKNFVGAKQELKTLYDFLDRKQTQEKISNELTHQGIKWRFIPPRAPNFGGLWEAAVRNVKSSLKRVIGLRQLSFEDFTTLLVQISAALNSRPLTPLTDDPADIDALTPSHFLIGSRMTDLPDPDIRNVPTNRLTHYQQRQQLFQHYWHRWSKEYLTELQASTKIGRPHDIQVGDVVVLREDNIPPLNWPLARVIAVHPGDDNVIRVVTVRTATGIYKRPSSRLCPLPIDKSASSTETLLTSR
ncbi:uncharacterized protein LOC129743154 [Uranotaenia lowii]|uniref:uncharacterized protein LOC129743154 n=1 Tax=Uranotaenia lowii TaxID=190385 RepID=UPI00247AD8F6|nr:uncharacterized protein LOC129743154 [Uranotaenia lowii]